jgi:peptidoglycan hydrolase-like protein with peptidoglycan-binding domain
LKNILRATLALLLFTVGVAAQTTNSPAAQPSPSPTPAAATTEVKKRPPVFRANKDQISQAQILLKGKTLFAGEPDGKMSEDFRTAIRQFQSAEKLKVTGTLNRATLEKMNIKLTEKQLAIPVSVAKDEDKPKSSAPRFRATKDQIMQAQKFVKDKGWYTGEADGAMNEDFRAALRKFQESANIKVTGTMSRDTVEKMGIPFTDKQKAAVAAMTTATTK